MTKRNLPMDDILVKDYEYIINDKNIDFKRLAGQTILVTDV